MKKLRELQGGYPRQQDYLLTLQNELMTLGDSLFSALAMDMVLKGCEVTDNGNGTVNIAAGIVYVSGEVVRFDGASNVVSDGSMTFVKDAAANTDAKVFGDGLSKEVYTEVKAVVGAKTSISEIAIGTTLYNLKTYIQDVVSSYAVKGELKDIYDLDGTFLDNFDATGLGVTARYSGWALFNGNNGTPNGQGRTRITAGSIVDSDGVEHTYDHGETVGTVRHKLTITEMPKHKHSLDLPTMNFENDGGSGPDVGRDGGDSRNFSDKVGEAGGGAAHNNMQPSIAVYTIIKIV